MSRSESKYISRSSAQTKRLAKKILQQLLRKKNRPLILALAGELGSGKTTFIQGLARALGIHEKIQSPTFVLAKWYRLPKRVNVFRHFIHIDCYRLEKPTEARHFNFPALLKDPDAIAVIEWSDRIKRLIPQSAVWLHFKHRTKNSRLITVKP